MQKGKLIFEGNNKKIYECNDSNSLILQFKDGPSSLIQLSAHGPIHGNGILYNTISGFIMQKLSDLNIPTHFIAQLNMREQMVHCLDMFPFRVVMRNYAAGNMMRKFGLIEGTKLPKPMIEYYIDAFEDTDSENMCLIDKSHIESMGWATKEEIDQIEEATKRANDFMNGLFSGIKLKLANFSLSFGRHFSYEEEDIKVMIGNEISPKTCRLWEDTSENKFKFRYISLLEVAERLKLLPQHAENSKENSKPDTKQDIYKLSDKV